MLSSHFDVKGLIPHVPGSANISPRLEGPQSLSGRDLSENLKAELQFRQKHKSMQALVMSKNNFLFR